MTVERPHEVFAPPTDAGSTGHQDNLLISFAALQEQAPPEIIELVSILYDTYTVRNQLQAAATETIAQQERSVSPSNAVERYGGLMAINPSFTERYRRAGLFVEAVMHIMRGSFTAYPEDPAYLRATIDAAYRPYGFLVAEGKGEIDVQHSAYHSSIEQQIENYEESRKKHMLPRGNPLALTFIIGDDYLWEPAGLWEEEPEVLFFTEQINHVRKVQLKLTELERIGSWFRSSRSEESAEHVPGLHSYFRERYSKARMILDDTADGVMMDGIRWYPAYNNFMWLHSMTYAFNEALYDLDMHIDVNPSWEPDQTSPSVPETTRERITKIEEVKE